MKSIWNKRPSPDEYGSFYQTYIDKLGEGNIIEILQTQHDTTHSLIKSLTPEQALYRYEKGKWTVKEVIGHVIDTERVFAYRTLAISRKDRNELPGFDQDEYVDAAAFNNRSLQSLADDYDAQRNAGIHLFNGLAKEMLDRKGVANGYELTVRAIPFIVAGHERHHLGLLQNRYGLEFDF